MDEKALLIRLSDGDEHAFELLYQRYHTSIYRFLIRYVHSPELAEDLIQELFMKIWDKREDLGHIQSFKSYVYVLARNLALNSLKRIAVSEVAIKTILSHYPQQPRITEDDLQYKEYNQMLQEVLNTLPERSREVFRLCREEGSSYEEAAKTLGISRNAIKNHMVYSMKRLKMLVEEQVGINLPLFLYFPLIFLTL